jgi:hypothetical protein
MRLVNPDSLLDVYQPLSIVFSQKVKKDSVIFVWDPVFSSSLLTLNKTCDTATITLLENLSYNTNYTLRGNYNLVNENNDTLKNIIQFKTINGEQEPNNTISEADTLIFTQALGGDISPRGDKDIFLLHPPTSDSILIILSHLTDDADMELLNASGAQIIGLANNTGKTDDTITTVLDSLLYFPVKVYSKNNAVSGVQYRLNAVRKY